MVMTLIPFFSLPTLFIFFVYIYIETVLNRGRHKLFPILLLRRIAQVRCWVFIIKEESIQSSSFFLLLSLVPPPPRVEPTRYLSSFLHSFVSNSCIHLHVLRSCLSWHVFIIPDTFLAAQILSLVLLI